MIEETFLKLRELIRRDDQLQWVFYQNKTSSGKANFIRDELATNRYWTGDWTKPHRREVDRIAYWDSKAGQLYIGFPSTEPRLQVEDRWKIPFDHVEVYKVSDFSLAGHSLMALLRDEVKGLGTVCTYWPKNVNQDKKPAKTLSGQLENKAVIDKPVTEDAVMEDARREPDPDPMIVTIADEVVGMRRRLVWMQKNQARFRDPVIAFWGNKCAVTGSYCNGLLVASYIKPWSKSSPREKVDVNNGLLLSASLAALFDRGLIGFSSKGMLIRSTKLENDTAENFGIRHDMKLPKGKPTKKMQAYLKWHRASFEIE